MIRLPVACLLPLSFCFSSSSLSLFPCQFRSLEASSPSFRPFTAVSHRTPAHSLFFLSPVPSLSLQDCKSASDLRPFSELTAVGHFLPVLQDEVLRQWQRHDYYDSSLWITCQRPCRGVHPIARVNRPMPLLFQFQH